MKTFRTIKDHLQFKNQIGKTEILDLEHLKGLKKVASLTRCTPPSMTPNKSPQKGSKIPKTGSNTPRSPTEQPWLTNRLMCILEITLASISRYMTHMVAGNTNHPSHFKSTTVNTKFRHLVKKRPTRAKRQGTGTY